MAGESCCVAPRNDSQTGCSGDIGSLGGVSFTRVRFFLKGLADRLDSPVKAPTWQVVGRMLAGSGWPVSGIISRDKAFVFTLQEPG